MLKFFVGAFLITGALYSCQLTQKARQAPVAVVKAGQPRLFELAKAMRVADTVAIRGALTGDWQLEKVCHSTFIGPKCDSSLQQRWLMDSLGRLSWVNGDGATLSSSKAPMKDKYHFVTRAAAEGATDQGTDSVWILHIENADRNLMIRTLDSKRLVLTEYPLIADNTTTYYLKRSGVQAQP